jgi:phage FluMu protein Com
VLRIVCPACKLVFLRVEIADETGVTCPRCATVFQPEEEEIYDPEND